MPPLWDVPDAMAVAVITAEGVVLIVLATLIGHVWRRVADLESAYATLWANREADAITKRRMGDHIDVLEQHIWDRKGPPPPPRPTGV